MSYLKKNKNNYKTSLTLSHKLSYKCAQISFYVCLTYILVQYLSYFLTQDAVTDLSADSEPLEMPGIQEGRAHKGILHAAKYIQQIIIELQLLNKAFEKAPVSNYK